ncbi:MAG: N-acetyl-gamma-glutamyl-phosphate reductase [Eubacterium sp.]|nr:N-acetyl-gamma-glutamyl-phosphate reductase [Candidatus Colimonas fimequi]
MKYKVFVDGGEGTTGLKIHEYFKKRDDIELLTIDSEKRKDLDERLSLITKADVSFLCLPDAAAREIAAAAPKDARILDTSTAHRTAPDWTYGMPEITKTRRDEIRESNRVAVPGCHASGTIMLIKPLLDAGIVDADYPFAVTSLTGYSGGGKKMIAQYEAGGDEALLSPRQYGIAQHHKHLPEIMAVTGIKNAPGFMPIVANYYSGMEVTIPIQGCKATREQTLEIFKEFYDGQKMVSVLDSIDDGGFIAANRLAGTNRMEITVEGNDDNILLVATYDNLGKGASGAAVQNMNIMLGLDEEKGLL